ncbi:MAG: Protein containing transglutaminase-like domain, putative cysteine protease [uncultured Sulfurovum sp.]|uniref:Protein containing transglutaminase-like domain, putative cysteine protease n=1 Tax=uncultured Sulfurovum sp. TaxID=269237 RepID=A0A6S6T252_9BACT|nr:MAG: Protein containing transglutaminase-like domain, putative cysteine protease [uncultured Sulfurovum sp.]
MIYDIYHKTAFKYENDVTFSHNIARLKPKNTPHQKLLSFSMEIDPEVYESREFTDMFGNTNTHMLIREPHQSLSVIGRSKVEILSATIDEHINMIKANSISYKEAIERLNKFQSADLYAKQFLFESQLIPYSSEKIKKYAYESFHEDRDLFEATQEFMERIFNDFAFVSGFSDITTPIEKIFEEKKGVCQDFAQFAISALRTIGLPAKYMSGYIETLPAKGEKKLFGADASHAWFSVYIPNAGWIEFDPTNNIIPREQHILLGSGRDYHDISPLKGVVFSSGNSELSVMVDVRKSESEIVQMMSQSQSQSQQ